MLRAIVALGFAASAAWATGRVMTDSIAVIQSVHWIPTVVALGFTVSACIGAGLLRRRRTLVALIVIAVVQAGFVLAQDWHPWRRATDSVGGGPGRLRVAHLNANWPGASSRRFAEALATVTRLAFGPDGADIVMISERGDILASANEAEMIPPNVQAIVVGRFAVISRVKVTRAKPLFDDGSVAAVLVEFEVDPRQGPMRVLLIDTPSSPGRSRIAVMDSLRGWIDRTLEGAPDLVIGDFNTPGGAASMRSIMSGLTEAFDLAGTGWGGTFPRTFPLWHIDQLWCGPRVTPCAYETIDPGIGQHRAQAAVLELSSMLTPSGVP